MDIEGECPVCGSDVSYDDWLPSEAEGEMRCPSCMSDVDIDEVFPEAE